MCFVTAQEKVCTASKQRLQLDTSTNVVDGQKGLKIGLWVDL